MTWLTYFSWYLAGAVLGLTIAQLMTPDEVLSYQILMVTIILVSVNFVLLIIAVLKATRNGAK